MIPQPAHGGPALPAEPAAALAGIDRPADLRAVPAWALGGLAAEIRDDLIVQSVSANGGHHQSVGDNGKAPRWQVPDRLLVSIGADGNARGQVSARHAHTEPGTLHLAVSVQVVDPVGDLWLLQRRAASKPLFPDRWANSCCTHPAPGEDLAHAARRRLQEETGLAVDHLTLAGEFTYRAPYGDSGLVEHEHDYVFVAVADTSATSADPDEISDLIRLPYAEALHLVESDAGAPWAAEVLRRAAEALAVARPLADTSATGTTIEKESNVHDR